MGEQQDDVSPATAGGASASTVPVEHVRAAAGALARTVGCIVVDAATQRGVSTSDQLRRVADKLHDLLGQESCAMAVVRGYHLDGLVNEVLRKFAGHPANVPLPPFELRPVLGEPAVNMDGDEDGNEWFDSVGWSLSLGCQLTFGRNEGTDELIAQVSMSDMDLRRGITKRTATRAQVAMLGRMLVERFGDPVGPDPRDAELAQLRAALARYQKRLGDDLLTGGKLVDRVRAALRVDDGSTCTSASMDGVVGDVGRLCDEVGRLRGDLTETNRRLYDALAGNAGRDADIDNREEEIERLLGALRSARQHAEFLQADAAFWRSQYQGLQGAVDALTGTHKKYRNELPPEPPVGTIFTSPRGTVWTRKDDGWHCSRKGCENCPADWNGEVWDHVRAGTVRYLPGQNAAARKVAKPVEPLCGAGNEDYPELRCKLAAGHRDDHEDPDQGATWSREAATPAEPRRWVSGDAEPEIGTTVQSAGGGVYTLLKSGYWHRDDDCYHDDPSNCVEAGYSWSWLTGHAQHLPLVEVVSTDGE